MTLAATVLIPTHEHGSLLTLAARSALKQTVRDLEVLIVGDGVNDATRTAAQELAQEDPRVRFFDLPKGPNRGETLRHQVMQEARGEIVCCLCDDDLYLPGHVESMRELLRDADFAHALPTQLTPDGNLEIFLGHLENPGAIERMQGLWNFIPLSCGAHTLAFYRKLPHGWKTSPPGVWTDLFMWRQFLTAPGCRSVSGWRPTVLHFPTPDRKDWSIERRLEEMQSWFERLDDPQLEQEMTRKAIDRLTARGFAEYVALESVQHQLDKLAREASVLWEQSEDRNRRIQSLESELVETRKKFFHARDELQGMQDTITWRLRNRAVRWPFFAKIVRRLGRRKPSPEVR